MTCDTYLGHLIGSEGALCAMYKIDNLADVIEQMFAFKVKLSKDSFPQQEAILLNMYLWFFTNSYKFEHIFCSLCAS